MYKRLRAALKDNASYRTNNLVWLEGEHLCNAALSQGWRFKELVLQDSKLSTLPSHWLKHADLVTTITEPLMQNLSQLPSSTGVLACIELSDTTAPSSLDAVVVLDQVQDPGNAGSMMRCAAAFGFTQIITTNSMRKFGRGCL